MMRCLWFGYFNISEMGSIKITTARTNRSEVVITLIKEVLKTFFGSPVLTAYLKKAVSIPYNMITKKKAM